MAKFRMMCIDPPLWATQPELSVASVTVAEFTAIQCHREKLLRVVHREIENYLDNPRLVFDGNEDGFPHRRRLTGAYYIGRESYTAYRDPDRFVISIFCRCLEHPKPGVDRDDDYLGLEVWLKCVSKRWASFEVFRNTDSSSI